MNRPLPLTINARCVACDPIGGAAAAGDGGNRCAITEHPQHTGQLRRWTPGVLALPSVSLVPGSVCAADAYA